MFLNRKDLLRLVTNVRAKHIADAKLSSYRTVHTRGHICIPKPLDRSSTDLLYVIAKTVDYSMSSVQYKYIDDCFLLPLSNVSKRNFAVVKEAGRKAATWLKSQHELNLLHEAASIKFAMELVDSKQLENELQRLIVRSQISEAMQTYSLMKQKNLHVNPNLKQSFLELLCFYNHKDPMPEYLIEERSYIGYQLMRDRGCTSWKNGGLAEEIFADIVPKTAMAYAAMIRGVSKYLEVNRAYALLQEAVDAGFELDTITFNSVISAVHLVEETPDKRWDLCQSLLRKMVDLKIQPDVSTLNALLKCINTFSNIKISQDLTLNALAEFKKFGVAPSLGSYYYVLRIFGRDRTLILHTLITILRETEGKEFNVMHPKDAYFFTTAMDICRNLQDKVLAQRLDSLFHIGTNYGLVGDTHKECIYYRNFLTLYAKTDSIVMLMQAYDLLVPYVYIPEPGIMEEILLLVEVNAAYHLLPRLWSDMVTYDLSNRESLLQRVVKIILEFTNIEKKPKELTEQFSKIVLDIYNKIKEFNEHERKWAITGQLMGEIITLLLHSKDFLNAVNVFTAINKDQRRFPGTPSEACMIEFMNACIEHKSPKQALLCLEYASQNHMDTAVMIQRINNEFPYKLITNTDKSVNSV